VIHVFPAWPRDWDAEYSLLARGAFLVSTSIRNGEIPRIEILSNAGSKCLVRNPWKGRAVALSGSQRSERLNGSLLTFQTTRGEQVGLKPV